MENRVMSNANMNRIKAVIFDWGGVLIDDPVPGLMQYCADTLGAEKEKYTQAHRKFADDFQKGIISEDMFWTRVCGELGVPKPRGDSLWGRAFKTVYSPKKEMFSLARSLQKNGYKTALLSNAEAPAMKLFYQQEYHMFSLTVFSCIEGAAKPERKIYELTLKRLQAGASESVLIDDRQSNIDGAKQVGLNTILFESIGQTEGELHQLGVKIT